jgi:hypothetical protein
MPAAPAKSQTRKFQMPNRPQIHKTKPKFDITLFEIVWDLAFGLWLLVMSGLGLSKLLVYISGKVKLGGLRVC